MKHFKKLLACILVSGMVVSFLPATISAEDEANEKEETVYLITDASGSTTETIVSSWLKNNEGNKTIADKCNLSTVENVKGKEKYTTKDGVNTWKANGKDIYYQGESKESAPVGVKVTYTLDGKEVSAKEIAGKSGTVKIHYEYTNNAKMTINGKEVYVPFVMVTGLILDNDVFSNVAISNGKIINDGDRSIAIGYGLPNLDKSLGVSTDKVDLNGFDVTASAKDFELTNTLTYASSELLNELDLDNVTSVSGLTSQLDLLSSSANQLEEGSKTLNTGLLQLQSKIPTLSSGITQLINGGNVAKNGSKTLADGANKLNESYSVLDTGIKSATTGSSQILAGLNQVNAGVDKLVNGQAQLQTGIDNAYNGLGTLRTYLNNSIVATNQAITKDTTAAGEIGAILAGVQAGTVTNLTPDQITALQTALTNLIVKDATSGDVTGGSIYDSNVSLKTQQGVLAALTDTENHNTTGNLADGLYQLKAGIAQIGYGLNGVPTDLQNNPGLKNAVNSLISGTTSLNTGLKTASAGSDQVSSGLATLNGGATQLSSGVLVLNNGLNSLGSQLPTLSNGIEQLASGSTTLADSMAKFNAEGIQKIVSLFKGDFQTLTTNLDDIVKAGQSYNSFTGLSDGMDGSVKFIIKTGDITKK